MCWLELSLRLLPATAELTLNLTRHANHNLTLQPNIAPYYNALTCLVLYPHIVTLPNLSYVTVAADVLRGQRHRARVPLCVPRRELLRLSPSLSVCWPRGVWSCVAVVDPDLLPHSIHWPGGGGVGAACSCRRQWQEVKLGEVWFSSVFLSSYKVWKYSVTYRT